MLVRLALSMKYGERANRPVLKILYTNPEYQHRGVAAALLDWGCRKADQLGLTTYLESSPVARDFYPKFGFIETKTYSLTWDRWSDRPPVQWFQMVRKPEG